MGALSQAQHRARVNIARVSSKLASLPAKNPPPIPSSFWTRGLVAHWPLPLNAPSIRQRPIANLELDSSSSTSSSAFRPDSCLACCDKRGHLACSANTSRLSACTGIACCSSCIAVNLLTRPCLVAGVVCGRCYICLTAPRQRAVPNWQLQRAEGDFAAHPATHTQEGTQAHTWPRRCAARM